MKPQNLRYKTSLSITTRVKSFSRYWLLQIPVFNISFRGRNATNHAEWLVTGKSDVQYE